MIKIRIKEGDWEQGLQTGESPACLALSRIFNVDPYNVVMSDDNIIIRGDGGPIRYNISKAHLESLNEFENCWSNNDIPLDQIPKLKTFSLKKSK